MHKIKSKLESDKFYTVIRSSVQMNHKIKQIRDLTIESEKNKLLFDKFAKEMTKNEKFITAMKAKL